MSNTTQPQCPCAPGPQNTTIIKYDPATLLGFTTSLLAIISCIFTLITLSRDWRRRADFARDVIDVHQREIDVLKRVMGECRGIIGAFPATGSARLSGEAERDGEADGSYSGVILGGRQETVSEKREDVPQSILEALRMCEQREADLMRIMAMPETKALRLEGDLKVWSWWAVNLRLPLLEKDLKRRYEMFKEDVLLLRALCSELRSQRQLLEVTTGISRLVADYVELDGHGERKQGRR
ncbi:hypothetical protein QBC34DRAFT_386386 [Podospora aff. communis PSN243]|uniref:Uncharacterized protein n=1 Tax=Podospora aff. communis PSN243 TaxID=3040156 RepID=A0AAV9G7B8_9PEZI|nr:hypothetical protein QBC34DRAFT_386386 [Podospora aff. communis PSN243]